MDCKRFKVGDIVIGTPGNTYSVTNRGSRCIVTKESDNRGSLYPQMWVRRVDGTNQNIHLVQAKYFELEVLDGGSEYGI